VLSGVWSSRSWQKRRHDGAQALLVRFAEPFCALASRSPSPLPPIDRRDALAHAWRLLLQCQPHDSICGCSIDEVHRDLDGRLGRVRQLARGLVREAVRSLAGDATADYGSHDGIAIANPHPFSVTARVEVELQRDTGPAPFRILGPTGEVPYELLAPADAPYRPPAHWLRLRLHARDLPPHGLRLLALEPGEPIAAPPPETTLAVHPIRGGIEIVDRASGLRVVHTVEDEGDRGDLYDFCPRDDAPPRSSRDTPMGVHLTAQAIGRRVDVEVEVDNRAPDHRLRARFDLSAPPPSIWTDTPFGWIERTTPGTHPVSAITATRGSPPFAVGALGLHEVERRPDGAILLTLFRAVGWMSRGDLSTRSGHAGYSVPTPDAQGIGLLRFRYGLAVGDDAIRQVEPGLIGPRAVALARAQPADLPFLSVEPATVRLSILKRAADSDALIVRLCGGPEAVTARLRFFRPLRRAIWSDLDERTGAPIELGPRDDELALPIAAHDVVTVRIED
jgi:hypothetical protein